MREAHPHRHGPVDALDDAHDVGCAPARRHEVDQPNGALDGVELGLQHERVAAVGATGLDDLGGRGERPLAVLGVAEERGEARARVEAWEAEPVDAAVARHERCRLQVADEAVVLDPRGHDPHATPERPRCAANGPGLARALPVSSRHRLVERLGENHGMRAVVQRVSRASVRVDGEQVGACGRGLLVLLGVGHEDTTETAERLAGKIARLRIFENTAGRFDLSLREVAGEALVVSQFTVLADTRKGNRPSFTGAAQPEAARPVVERFADALRAEGVPVETGVFGARMDVELVNDGPVTIVVDA